MYIPKPMKLKKSIRYTMTGHPLLLSFNESKNYIAIQLSSTSLTRARMSAHDRIKTLDQQHTS